MTIRRVKISDIKGSKCGWFDCQEFSEITKPDDWVALIVSPKMGKVKMKGHVGMVIDFPETLIHDKVLCPHHASLINEFLEIGPYSRKVGE